MGGMGQAPKPAATRQRRNKKSTANRFEHDTNAEAEVPELPKVREWHSETVEEWDAIWTSPMAGEFLDTDYFGLLKLIVLIDDYWEAESSNQRASLSVEIRLQRQSFGLDPVARARLHWEIGRGDEAEARRRKREAVPVAAAVSEAREDDPRALLGRQGGLVVLPGGKLAA